MSNWIYYLSAGAVHTLLLAFIMKEAYIKHGSYGQFSWANTKIDKNDE